MPGRQQHIDFDLFAALLMDIDGLKLTERRSYVAGKTRLENTAEHSWHEVLAAWILAKHASSRVSIEKVLKLAAIHDLCELDHGDTCVLTGDQAQKMRDEASRMSRLMSQYGSVFEGAEALWWEYEECVSEEAKLVRAADRLLPFLQNLVNEGNTWRERGVSRSQVQAIWKPLSCDFPELVDWVQANIDAAVEAGWLDDV